MSPPDVGKLPHQPSPGRQRNDGSADEAIYPSRFFIASLSNFFFFSSVNAFSLLPLYIKALGGTESQIGGIMGTYSLTAILAQPLAGAPAAPFGGQRVLPLGWGVGVRA